MDVDIPRFYQVTCISIQSYAKYLEKVNNFSKTGQDYQALISTFAYFLTAVTKFTFTEGRWTLSPPKFEIF